MCRKNKTCCKESICIHFLLFHFIISSSRCKRILMNYLTRVRGQKSSKGGWDLAEGLRELKLRQEQYCSSSTVQSSPKKMSLVLSIHSLLVASTQISYTDILKPVRVHQIFSLNFDFHNHLAQTAVKEISQLLRTFIILLGPIDRCIISPFQRLYI